MFSNSILEFFIFGIIFSTLILILIKGFGLFKLHYVNLKWLKKIKQLTKDTDNSTKKEALLATINHCQNLNSKFKSEFVLYVNLVSLKSKGLYVTPVENLFADKRGFVKIDSSLLSLSFFETESNKSMPTEKVSLSLA